MRGLIVFAWYFNNYLDNDPPVFVTQERSFTKKKGTSLVTTIQASDPHGRGPVSFSLSDSTKYPGIRLEPNGTLTWSEDGDKSVSVAVVATEVCGKTTTENFALNIEGEGGTNVGLIVGLAVGGVVVVAAGGALVGAIVYKKKRIAVAATDQATDQ
jgi:hypothetical protein